jgi:hypothetical protein
MELGKRRNEGGMRGGDGGRSKKGRMTRIEK